MAIKKIFSSQEPTNEILFSLDKEGLVIFSERKTRFAKLYDKLEQIMLQRNILQGNTKHATEGCFYFIYDSEIYSYTKVVELIRAYWKNFSI